MTHGLTDKQRWALWAIGFGRARLVHRNFGRHHYPYVIARGFEDWRTRDVTTQVRSFQKRGWVRFRLIDNKRWVYLNAEGINALWSDNHE